jgi:hypothetical protein
MKIDTAELSDSRTKQPTDCSRDLLALLSEAKEYIERVEVRMDGEWGSCRSVPELIRDNEMPELYTKVCNILIDNACQSL